jgi:hypothetical protein
MLAIDAADYQDSQINAAALAAVQEDYEQMLGGAQFWRLPSLFGRNARRRHCDGERQHQQTE